MLSNAVKPQPRAVEIPGFVCATVLEMSVGGVKYLGMILADWSQSKVEVGVLAADIPVRDMDDTTIKEDIFFQNCCPISKAGEKLNRVTHRAGTPGSVPLRNH